MRWRVVLIKTLLTLGAFFAIGTGILLVEQAVHFEGTCGGLVPSLVGATPCTLPQYLWQSLGFTCILLFVVFWPLLLFAILVSFAISVLIEKYHSRKA